MRCFSLYGAIVESAIQLPAPAAASEGHVDCTVSVAQESPADGIIWFHAWRYPRRAPSVIFGRRGDGYVLRVPHAGDFGVSSDGRSVDIPAALPIDSGQHLLADLVLPLAMSRQRDLLLHASTVHLPDVGALAMVGASGRGKSSLAAALIAHGASVLSDDCTATTQLHDVPAALPGYPGIRLWPESLAMLVPPGGLPDALASGKVRVGAPHIPFRGQPSGLGAIVMLSRRHRGGGLKVRRISQRTAVVHLMRHAFIMDVTDRSQLARVFGALTSLVARVPILRIALEDDRASLEAAAGSVVTLARSIVRNRRGFAA